MFDHEATAREVEARFGRFFREKINPTAAERDQTGQTFSVELLREMADLGLIGFTAPVEIGGAGRSWQEWGHTLEEIGYRCDDAGLPMLLSYRETATNLIYESGKEGREHLVERYAEPAVRGEAFIGWLLTEETGPWSLQTKLVRRGDRLILNGNKAASTGGMSCTSWIVYAATEDGQDTVAVMVDRDDPGVVVTPLPTLGLRSIGLAEVSFTDVELDPSRVLAPNDGLTHSQRFINERRVTGASWLPGRMRALIERVIDDAAPKERFGREIIDLDTFHAAIGRMYIAMQTVRSTTYRTLEHTEAGRHDRSFVHDPMLSVGKYVAVECALELAGLAQKLTGGHGYFDKHDIHRTLRDFYGLSPILGGQLAIESTLGSSVIFQHQRRRAASADTARHKEDCS
ncbi:MAG: alkylation response protein AidB-like acyl-CoA dehydrogenase [Myxococcota bacterium]